MTILHNERECLERYLPGLDKLLADIPLAELEKPGSDMLATFRQLGGPALLVPEKFGGKGASLVDAVRISAP